MMGTPVAYLSVKEPTEKQETRNQNRMMNETYQNHLINVENRSEDRK